ncbi:Nucleotidyltransferase family protein isoform 2 [Capsicum annuum]|nr:Nucleotidyltransferase family protein isoform 2 [Capsicum annuum]KAF3684480.1 Nucleotidyltransferase family protein isoform 2 [Capsicum annuum]
MTGGGGDAATPPLSSQSTSANGGEFLLQLLQSHPHHHHRHHSQPPPSPLPPQPTPPELHTLPPDPAVAAVGPSMPFPPFHQAPTNPSALPYSHSPPLYVPHNFFIRGCMQNPNPNYSSPPPAPSGFSQYQHGSASPLGFGSVGQNMGNLGIFGKGSNSSHEFDQNLIFGSLSRDIQGNVSMLSDDLAGKVGNFAQKNKESRLGNVRMLNGVESKLENAIGSGRKQLGNLRQQNSTSSVGGSESGGFGRGGQFHRGNVRGAAPPPGFSSKSRSREFEHNVDNERSNFVELNNTGIGVNHKYERESKHLLRNGKNYAMGSDDRGVFRQLDSPGPPAGSKLHSVLVSDVEDSMLELRGEDAESGGETVTGMRNVQGRSVSRGQSELDELGEHLISSLGIEDEPDERSDKKKHHASRDKDYRSDKRGAFILGQRMRMLKRQIACRSDINRMNGAFLSTYESLIPPEEEKIKQKQLLALLDGIVSKEWPDARLYVYGSCANSFGFSKSDIDICLAIEDANIDKSEVLLKLADMLQLDNLQNVQALTRARVPIVKLMDPETGISCDICVNNVLAVVNTKLLRDYAQIDVRLRQLAFIVKHWAKSRGVNETYQGTLSSYAYVLMCIHFLQQRRPAILPCLQGMEATYSVTVDNVECAYFDKVEKLYGFGSHNGESLARLVWAFFNYWAYCHDYANDVISVRSGSTVSKRAKDWTRRIGNDRHLICIEDPFEVSHDLGRVVDKFSIRVLREEFERAAEIMQYDPNPCVKLFEPYVPS